MERLRKALEFYANDQNWTKEGHCFNTHYQYHTDVGPGEDVSEIDFGDVAKKALEEK